ncbi:hypothetical protein TNIN_49521 [Trichonephila inaurata madagascariensis]|uniref:Uncharacterized protein n=1 Tax=Trichonephila inaurata madagascariensis TaxID=2747483 RepID=A0A8X6YVS9_9ARAC|nr:hypothetical protein TNIN_49521 [Trichonephila inaurata madagascariensis]
MARKKSPKLLEDRHSFLFFRVTLQQTGVTPNRKSVVFKYRDGKTSAAVLKECIHLYRRVPPEQWTRKLIIPKNGNGELLPSSAFYLQFVMTPRGPCYTATYQEDCSSNFIIVVSRIISCRIGNMKRMFNSNNGSNKRVCFSEDTKSDSSFSDDSVPPRHFHLGQDVYASVTYFATMHPNVIFQRYFKKKDYSKKFVSGTCVLSDKTGSKSVMWLTFDRMLRNLLLSEASKIMPSAVMNTDASEVELVLTTSLIELLCDYLGNSVTDVFECYGCAQQYGNQLGHECITMD